MSSQRRRLQFHHEHRRERNTNDTTASSVASSAGEPGGPLSSMVSEWTEGDDTSIEGHANDEDDVLDNSAMPRRCYDPQQQQSQVQSHSSPHDTSFHSSDNDGSPVTFNDLTSAPTWLSGRGLGGVTDLDADRRAIVRGSRGSGLERDHDSFMSSDFSDQSSVNTGESSSSFTDSNTSENSGGNHPITASSPACTSSYGSSEQQGHQHHPLTAPAPSLHKQQHATQPYAQPKRQGLPQHSSLRSSYRSGGRNMELESINESSMESATSGSSSGTSTSSTPSQHSAEIPLMIDPTSATGAAEGRLSPRQQSRSRSPQSQQEREFSSSPSSGDPRSAGAIGGMGNRARSWRLAALRRNQQLGDLGGMDMTSHNTPGGDSSTAASFFSLSSFRISVPSSLSSNSCSASTWTSSSEDDTTTESGSAAEDQHHPHQQQQHHQVRQSVQLPYTDDGLEVEEEEEGDYEEEGDQRYDPLYPSPQTSYSPRDKDDGDESSSQSTSTESYLLAGKKMTQSGSLSTEPTLPDHPRVLAKQQQSGDKDKSKRRGDMPVTRQGSGGARGTAESTPPSSFDKASGGVAASSKQEESQEQQRQKVRNRLFQRKSQLPPHPRLKQKDREHKGLARASSKSSEADIVDKNINSKMSIKKQNSSRTLSTSSPTAASSLLSWNDTLATIADEKVGGRDNTPSPQRRRPRRGGNRRGISSGSDDHDLTEEEAKVEIDGQQQRGGADKTDVEYGLQARVSGGRTPSTSTSRLRPRELIDPIERERQDRAEIDRILKEAASKPRQTSVPRSILRNTTRVLARLSSGSTNASSRSGRNGKDSPRGSQSPPQASTARVGSTRDDAVALEAQDSNRNVAVLSHDKQGRYQNSRLWCLCAPVRTKTDTCITVAFVQALLVFIAVMIYFEVTWEDVTRTFTIGVVN
jgi:hypothetical protein